MPYVNISLDDVEDEDLILELEERGYKVHEKDQDAELIEAIYHKYRLGTPYEEELRQLLYMRNGRAV